MINLWVHCIAWFCFWLDASLLSSGYDHRWYRATQQPIYVVSVEEMAYIGSTWVKTVMWPVMMQTILISDVQEKYHVKETCRLISWGGWWQHQSRMEISCQTYQLTMKVSSPQKVDLNQINPCLMIGAILFPGIIQCHLCLIMTLGVLERGCTWCLSIWSQSFISSVSAWTIEVYIVLTSLFHYCSVSCHFQEWLDKQSSPDVPSIELLPGSISRSCPPSNEYDSPDGGHTKGGRKRKCAGFSSNWHW
jgi:hypothetical protein